MSTWLEEFLAKTDAIKSSRGAQTRSNTSQEAILRLLQARGATPNVSQKLASEPVKHGKSLSSMPGDIKDQFLSGGSRILDLLSRPNYASANFVGSLASDERDAKAKGNDVGIFGKGVDYDWLDALKAAGEGFSGESKKTYSDVFREQGKSGAGIGFGGFVADVALDPTTYIGAGAIKAGLKAGSKGVKAVTAGKLDLEALGRAKNVLSQDDVLTPAEKAAKDVETTGSAKVNKVNPSMVEKILAQRDASAIKAGEGDHVYDVVPNEWNTVDDHLIDSPIWADPKTEVPKILDSRRLLESSASKPRFTADSAGRVGTHFARDPKTGDVVPNAAQGFIQSTALKSAENDLERLLSDVRVKKYPEPLNIEAPFRQTDEVIQKEFPVEKTREVPNPDFKPAVDAKQVINEQLNRLVPENLDPTRREFRLYGRSGNPIQKIHLGGDDVKFGGKELAGDNVKIDRNVTVGKVMDRLPPKFMAKWIKEGKVPASMEGFHVKINGALVPVKDFVAEAHLATKTTDDVFDEAGNVATITEKYLDKELRDVTVSKMKVLNPVERMAWVSKMSQILEPDEVLYLNRNANLGPKVFAKAVERIQARTTLRSFNNVEELTMARDAGIISDEGLAVLTGRLESMNAQNVFRVKQRVDTLRKAAEKAANKPTKANKAAAAKAEKAAVKAVDDANVKANLSMDAADDIMKTPSVVENIQARVEQVIAGDTSEFAKPRTALSETQANIVQKVLKDVNDLEFVKPKGQPYRSGTGAARNSATPGVGQAWYYRGFNKYSQLTLGKKIIAEASKLVRGAAEDVRPREMYDMTMPMLDAAEKVLRQNGVPIILGKSSKGLPVSMHDVLSALPREFVEKFYFTPGSSFDITQLADITEQYVLKGLGQRDARTVSKTVEELLRRDTRKHGTSALNKMLKDMGSENAYTLVLGHIDNAFEQAGPAIMRALANNSAAAAIKVGEETKALSDAGIKAINDVITNPQSSAGDIIHAALNSSNPVRKAAAESANKVSPEAQGLAEEAVAAHLADTLPMPVVATYGRAAEAFNKATTTNDFAKIQVKLADSADVEAKGMLADLEAIDPATYSVLDLGMRAEFTNGVRMFRALAPHLGNENLRPILTERLSVNQSLSKRFTNLLAKINMDHPPAELSEAFARLQTGDPIDSPAMEALHSVMKELFDPTPNGVGLLKRNGIRPEHLASKFAHFGIGDVYKLNYKALDQSWREWPKIDDPLDFLSKFHAAIMSATADVQVGADISRMFGRARPGATGKWVQIRDTKGKSKLASLLNKDLFFPEDIARQMHMLDETMVELAKPHSQSKFLKVLDSALHSYKAGVTIYRPGHHVRNLIGDMWLSSMDGVSGSAYRRAWSVIGTRGSQYKDFDAVRALQDAYASNATLPKSVVSMKFNGETVHLSPDQVYRMAFDNGALPDYSVLEDVSFGSTAQSDKVAEAMKKFSPLRAIGKEGSLHKVATNTSEVRDHYVRIAHFIHALEQEKLAGKSLDEALKAASHNAGRRVRKWHPDGSDLSQFEKSTMRRTILFYSWVRKAIPLVVESMVTKPGRVMAYPKAMQNFAAMQGIDLEGHSGFPSDQLFPSYIADSVQGPQWGEAGAYMGMKPGIPSMDVLDEYASSPTGALRAVAGSVNPLAKVPMEVASGNMVRTGTPIQDSSDYVDSQIPGMNYLAKLLGGKSPSSVLVPGDGQMIQDTRVSPSNKGYAGNPNGPFGASPGGNDFINWLLGLGLTDYSRPSSIRSAQMERGGR